MTFEEVNKKLGDKTQGCDGYGTKLVRSNGKIYMVTIGSDAGDVGISEVEDSEENWARIAATFEASEDDTTYPSEERMQEAVEAHSTDVVSTSFWG